MSTHSRTLIGLSIICACFFLFLLVPRAFAKPGDQQGIWQPKLKFSGSLTSVGAAHSASYRNVSGIGGTEENVSWIARMNGRWIREFEAFSQDHRLSMEYGKTDREESQDSIDFNNILRYQIQEPTFLYSNARVRSEFDTFGHPTTFNGSAGFGTRLIDSDELGRLEFRTGPRGERDWNPSTSWELYYELVAEYEKAFGSNGEFTSELESYTLTRDPDQYTVRWENKLTSSVNSWLELEYEFTLYYEDVVGEVATKNIATINLTYHVFD